ncbi:MAG TPA: sodium:solute symporter family protein [Spirochaetota bacterium]|nr:sodium:solute symporter family protein [Spirochaetota bacterium]
MSLAITIIFLAAVFLIGILKTGSNNTTADFFVSGRNGSTLRITGSLIATIIGGSATLGVAGLGFSMGLPALWWLLSGSVFLFILGIFFAGKVREMEVFTLPEVLYAQYGSDSLRIISSVVIIIAWLGIVSAQIAAAGKIINLLLPGHFTSAVILFGSIFIIYTMAGGQRSVIRTDAVQTVLIFSGIGLLFIILFMKFGYFWNLPLPEGHLNFPVNYRFSYYNLLGYFLFVGTSFLAGPDMYSRILSAKDKRTARNSVLAAAALVALFAIIITAIGIYGKSLYPGIESESVFPKLILEQLPEWIKGIVVATLLAAFLSSANTCLITSCIILNSDIINPLFFKGAMEERKQVFLTRILILIMGSLAILITLYLGGIIKSMLFALTIYTTGLIIPVVLGFYRKNLSLNRYGAIAAVITGSSVSLIFKFLSMGKYNLLLFPAVIIIIFTVSYLTKGKD